VVEKCPGRYGRRGHWACKTAYLRLRDDLDLLRGLLGLIGNRVTRLLNIVDGLLNDLLDLADGLVGLAFLTQLIVTGQCAGRFLDATFHFVCLAIDDATPVARGC